MFSFEKNPAGLNQMRVKLCMSLKVFVRSKTSVAKFRERDKNKTMR